MNWKEQLNHSYPAGVDHEKSWIEREAIKGFISKEIIEKLIGDIPDKFTDSGMDVYLTELKQQLRRKWLDEEN